MKSGSIQSAPSTHQQPGSASSDNQQPFSRFVSCTLCTEQKQGTSITPQGTVKGSLTLHRLIQTHSGLKLFSPHQAYSLYLFHLL